MREPQELPFLRALIGGFTLLIALLGASVYIGVGTMRSVESDTARLLEGQRAMLRLIEDVQRDEDSLSAVFYELAAANGASRPELLGRLDKLETTIRETTAAGLATGGSAPWRKVGDAVARFISEGRDIAVSHAPPSVEFYRAHEALISALGSLASYQFDEAADAQTRERETATARVQFSVGLLAVALGIALAATVMTIRIISRTFRQMQWQTKELSLLSSRTMADQEATARRFSRELHDEFGQTLSALEANLVAVKNSDPVRSNRIEDSLALVKQAIENARELSQLLRPSVLDDFGLDASVRWITDGFSQRTGIHVDYHSTEVPRLTDEMETQVFRILQEALTNVARHAHATLVTVELEAAKDHLVLLVTDNGTGISGKDQRMGLGLVGMRARARAMQGSLMLQSVEGRGTTIRLEMPLARKEHGSKDSNSAG